MHSIKAILRIHRMTTHVRPAVVDDHALPEPHALLLKHFAEAVDGLQELGGHAVGVRLGDLLHPVHKCGVRDVAVHVFRVEGTVLCRLLFMCACKNRLIDESPYACWVGMGQGTRPKKRDERTCEPSGCIGPFATSPLMSKMARSGSSRCASSHAGETRP